MKNSQNKADIIRVSKIIRNFLFAGLVFWAIAIPAGLFSYIGSWVGTGTLTPGAHYLHVGRALLMVLCMTANLKLFRFFDRLKNGYLFDAKTVRYLDHAGRWIVALWFFEILFHGIGHQFGQIGSQFFPKSIGWGDFGGSLFAGLTLIFVAWLLKEAQELQQETELTV